MNITLKMKMWAASIVMLSVPALAQTDMTSKITNPSFENDGFNGWTQSGMQTQSNSIFTKKDGNIYVEKWVQRGSSVGSANVTQVVRNLPPGRYTLTAAAQNIQENSATAQQRGAYVFANGEQTLVTTPDDYSVNFAVIDGTATLGFRAVSASGNWLCCDNFRLTKVDGDLANELAAAIAEAQTVYGEGTGNDADALNAAIEAAQQLAADASVADQAAAIIALQQAVFLYRLANPTGAVPTVTTNPLFLRGANQAFARMTMKSNGASMQEQGFCWSEQPEPTIMDNRTTEYLENSGRIYWLRDMKPATIYYARAYVLTKGYQVAYGDVIKIVTLPRGTVTWTYDNGADAEANARINAAVKGAVDYWNDLTNISGFGTSVHYGSGTPTADCSYGGWMRIGPNASYQRIGTVMHEMLHGIGVGTHWLWYGPSSPLRAEGSRGLWLGERATNVIRFWDNNASATLTGDDTHLWPYGINGAHEDTGAQTLYICTSLLAQAIGEDGLPCSGSRAFGSPSYIFEQDDNQKYYIKNENADRGLYDSYLVQSGDTMVWRKMSAQEAAANDSSAWYITFTPKNQYYQFRNAATGYYMCYVKAGANGICMRKHTQPTANDNFQLMKGRVDVKMTSGTTSVSHKGYWLIHPVNTSASPATLTAAGGGALTTQPFDLANSASAQRWIILTMDQAEAFETASVSIARQQLNGLFEQMEKLLQVPHREDVSGADELYSEHLAALRASAEAATTASDVSQLKDEARQAAVDFLSTVSPLSIDQLFDLTWMITNPAFDKDGTDGWSASVAPAWDYQENEYYEKSFNFSQTIPNMPVGNYELHAQAFHRPGETDAVYTAFSGGKDNTAVYLMLDTKEAKVKNIMADRQKTELYNDGGWASDKKLADNTYVPNSMAGAAQYLKKGLYDNLVQATLAANGPLKVGIRGVNSTSYYWALFDNFRLYYFGRMPFEGLTTISQPVAYDQGESGQPVIYTLTGQRVSVPFNALPSGIYVVGGKKVLKR